MPGGPSNYDPIQPNSANGGYPQPAKGMSSDHLDKLLPSGQAPIGMPSSNPEHGMRSATDKAGSYDPLAVASLKEEGRAKS